jgi:hypothetical protein
VTEWWWPVLFLVGAALIAQNLLAARTKGVIEMRSLVVEKDESPGLFWFTVVLELFFFAAFIALAIDWFFGGPLFGFRIQ